MREDCRAPLGLEIFICAGTQGDARSSLCPGLACNGAVGPSLRRGARILDHASRAPRSTSDTPKQVLAESIFPRFYSVDHRPFRNTLLTGKFFSKRTGDGFGDEGIDVAAEAGDFFYDA